MLMFDYGKFIKENRKKLDLTQAEIAKISGVGLKFIRELEQGKQNVKIDKLNQVLYVFSMELVPERKKYDDIK